MAVPSAPVAASTTVKQAMFDFVDAYDRAYETAAGEHGLSVAQACVLGRLTTRRGMGELAAELGCDASNITQIVARLEARPGGAAAEPRRRPLAADRADRAG